MVQKTGHSNIVGKEAGSSRFAIYANSLPNLLGVGAIDGIIRDHRGSAGIGSTRGVRILGAGITLFDGTVLPANLNVTIHNNQFDSNYGVSTIDATVDGQDSVLNFIGTNNVFTNPVARNRMGVRVNSGNNSRGLSLTANVTLKNNLSIAGTNGAAYQLVQSNESILNLTAPAGNSQIGNSLLNSDGGVIMSDGDTGNNNENADGKDVIARGLINIVEEF